MRPVNLTGALVTLAALGLMAAAPNAESRFDLTCSLRSDDGMSLTHQISIDLAQNGWCRTDLCSTRGMNKIVSVTPQEIVLQALDRDGRKNGQSVNRVSGEYEDHRFVDGRLGLHGPCQKGPYSAGEPAKARF